MSNKFSTSWFVAIAIVSTCWGRAALKSEENERQPNVILILADDMAIGDISSLNGGISRTPNLDRLIDDSVWFNQAYSGSCVCAPARAALLTGRYPHRTGVVTLDMEKFPELTQLRRDEITMADIFRGNGYSTGMIGKWHLGIGESFHPLDRGFDEFEGFVGHLYVPSYFNFQLDIQRETRPFPNRYLTTDLSQRAIDYVRRHCHQPFFLHLAHYAPHRPIEAPMERKQPYLEAGLDEETATIYAMVEIMDEGIGELLSELDRLQIREHTILIFASDNGPDPLVAERFNLKLRGTKYTVHEGGIHVPLLIHWRDHFEPKVSDHLVHFTDLLPTLIDLCSLKSPSSLELDGTSQAGEFDGRAFDRTAIEKRVTTQHFWQWNRELPRYSHNAAIREGNWKLVRPFVTRNIPTTDSDLPPLLFDLSSDPKESRDIANDHPEVVQRLNIALEAWCQSVESDRTRP